jgi:hypothetical protein
MTHVVFSKSVPHMYYIKIKGELVQHRLHPQYKKHITGSTPAKPNKLLRPNGESTRLNTKAMNTAQQTYYPTTMKDASKAISRKTSKGNSESPRWCLQQGNRHLGVSTLPAPAGPSRAFAQCNLRPQLRFEGSARSTPSSSSGDSTPPRATSTTNCHS